MQNDITEVPVLAHLVEWLQCVCVVFIVLEHQATDACRLGLVVLVQLFNHRHLVYVKLWNKKTFALAHAVRRLRAPSLVFSEDAGNHQSVRTAEQLSVQQHASTFCGHVVSNRKLWTQQTRCTQQKNLLLYVKLHKMSRYSACYVLSFDVSH